MSFKTKSEKRAFRIGFLSGIRRKSKDNKPKFKKSKLYLYEFVACDDFGNKYNIRSYGTSKEDAVTNAEIRLRARDDSIGQARIIGCGSDSDAKFNLVFPR